MTKDQLRKILENLRFAETIYKYDFVLERIIDKDFMFMVINNIQYKANKNDRVTFTICNDNMVKVTLISEPKQAELFTDVNDIKVISWQSSL